MKKKDKTNRLILDGIKSAPPGKTFLGFNITKTEQIPKAKLEKIVRIKDILQGGK